jgi:hypothetical protein
MVDARSNFAQKEMLASGRTGERHESDAGE